MEAFPFGTELKLQKEQNIKACFNVPQVYIKANPNSSLSIVALNFLGNGTSETSPVHVEDLERLYNSLTNEVKNSEEGSKYAENLKKWKDIKINKGLYLFTMQNPFLKCDKPILYK